MFLCFVLQCQSGKDTIMCCVLCRCSWTAPQCSRGFLKLFQKGVRSTMEITTAFWTQLWLCTASVWNFGGTFHLVTTPLTCLNSFVVNTWYCFVCMEVIFLHSDFKENLEDKVNTKKENFICYYVACEQDQEAWSDIRCNLEVQEFVHLAFSWGFHDWERALGLHRKGFCKLMRILVKTML